MAGTSFILIMTTIYMQTTAILTETMQEPRYCVWSDYQKLECNIQILDDTFSGWVKSGNWPTSSNHSYASPTFKSSMLSSSLLSSSSLRASSSLLSSSSSVHRQRERRLVTSLTVTCLSSAKSLLSKETFKGLESLTTLALLRCNLSSIPSESFASLDQLKQLKVNSFFEDEELMSLVIEEKAIPMNLELINFSFNNIKSFPSFISCNIPHLSLLILSNNRIDSVERLGYFKSDFNANESKENEEIRPREDRLNIENEFLSKFNSSLEKNQNLSENSNSTESLTRKPSRINYLNNDLYTPCFRSLRSLSLNENEILELPPGGFKSLYHLEYLYVAKNSIKNVSHQAFFGLINLQVLDLSANFIIFIEGDTFSSCHHLEKLYLNNNSIFHLSDDIFSGLNELQILDLSFNNLTLNDNYKETFSGLRRLVILNLSHNKIPTLFSSVFKDLTSLQRLDISFNELSFIEENTFSRMFNLYELDLSNNKIYSLSSSCFSGLVGLNILNLSVNSLKNLHFSILHQSFNLKQILLSNNDFEELPSAVQNLSFLNKLDVSRNKILKIESYDFKRLTNLHVFNLSSNLLKNITKSTFNGLQSLVVLDLSDNNIDSIKEGSLDSIKDLKSLKLSRNQLGNINGLFAGMEYLEELDLSENQINMFDYAFLPRQLLKLSIRKNNVKQLGNYYKVHRVLALENIDASFNRIKVINEESLPNSIKNVSLEQNILHNVKPGTFTEKTKIEYMNFRMNQITKLNPKSISPEWINEKQNEAVLYLGGNSLICDCEMEWLYFASLPSNNSTDNQESNHRLPVIGDVPDVVCTLPHSIGNLTTYKKIHETVPDDFLCPYATHCFTLCHCCDFIACDCQMKCPNSCSCFHDDTWSINLVDCSRGSLNKLPDKIPMDATIVYLDGNNLQILHAHHFIGRHSVQKLFLNSSNIQTLQNRTFHGLSSLRYLYLQDNLIVQLSGFEFSGLGHLKELHLQNNRISFVSNKTFEKLSSLEVLRIDNNFIVNFPVWVLSKNVFLKRIALDNNPWDCGCGFISSLRQWMSYTKIIIINQDDLFCVIDGSKIIWSSAIEPTFSCLEGTKDVAHYQFGQRELPFLAGGLCGGIILVTALILVSLFFARKKAVAAHKLGYSTSICQEEDGKIFDAYISYSVKDSNFVRDIIATKLENNNPSFKLCLHARDFTESSRISDFITQSICFSRRLIIVLSKNYIENEWRIPSFRNSHVDSIKNKENNLIVINLDGVQDCLLEHSLKSIVKKANVLKWEEKNFWKRLSDYLPIKSMYSGFSLYISDPLYKSPIPLLSSPRNVELPSSSSVLTSTTGLTTPSDAGRSSIIHDQQATFKNNFSPRNCNINSCDYIPNTGRDIHIPSCHCQRIPQSIYSSIEGDSTSVHTYNSSEILSQQIANDRQPSPENRQYTIANAPVSPTTRGSVKRKCNSSPGSYDNVILSHEAYHRTSCRRRLGTPEEIDDYESSSSSISTEKGEEISEQEYISRTQNSPVLPGFPTDECFV